MRALLLVAVLLLAGCSAPTLGPGSSDGPDDAAPSTPPPPPPPQAGQVALRVGDSWTYRVATDEGNVTEVARVAEVRDGAVLVDRQTQRGTMRTELDAATLAIRSLSLSSGQLGGSASFDPPLPTVIPAEDHAWDGVLTIRAPPPLGASSQPAHAEVTFHGLDNVTVPAGALVAYKYRIEIESRGVPTFRQALDVWYAPEAKAYAMTRASNRTEELVSFQVG